MQLRWGPTLWYEANFWSMYTFYTLAFSLRTEGSRHMPRSGPVLVIANHESFLDPVAVGLAVRRHIDYLARKTLFNTGLFGSYLRSVGCIPVDQEGVAKEGIRRSIEVLHAGRALLVFPEGERTLTGKMNAFKPGITLLLKRVSVPIVPVGVAGAFEAFPRGRAYPALAPLFWPVRDGAMAVSVGRPIPSESVSSLPREKMLEALSQEVQTVADRAERLRRKG